MADFALRAAYYAKLPASGPVPLPKRIERWTVPRGNFVHKKSQENFERITYKRLIRIKDGNPETVELWLAFLKQHQYHGVGMKANVWGWDEIGVGKKMNVRLETLRDVPSPKWEHFGPRKSSDTAAMAQQILNSPEYRALEEMQNEPVVPSEISKAEAEESVTHDEDVEMAQILGAAEGGG
ncbi:ribosomal protein S10 domain-containing protein [Sphaerosporella brunnea]|uniref:Small ribosomal subunit protein uS10m n=1 Tax=Sphaerosporella brunnea TaxID=1250544 RepID=A0A5J5ESS0_9PEZI|nr:ribosomal protein S10 domain-containing protein [Sphaerosporella brunnea]